MIPVGLSKNTQTAMIVIRPPPGLCTAPVPVRALWERTCPSMSTSHANILTSPPGQAALFPPPFFAEAARSPAETTEPDAVTIVPSVELIEMVPLRPPEQEPAVRLEVILAPSVPLPARNTLP